MPPKKQSAVQHFLPLRLNVGDAGVEVHLAHLVHHVQHHAASGGGGSCLAQLALSVSEVLVV